MAWRDDLALLAEALDESEQNHTAPVGRARSMLHRRRGALARVGAELERLSEAKKVAPYDVDVFVERAKHAERELARSRRGGQDE